MGSRLPTRNATVRHVVALPLTTWPPSHALRRGLATASPIVRRISETVPTGPPLERLVPLLWPSSESSGAHGTPGRRISQHFESPFPTSELSPERRLRPLRAKDVWAGRDGSELGFLCRGLDCANDHVELLRVPHFAFLLVWPLNGRRSRPPNDLVPTVGLATNSILCAACNATTTCVPAKDKRKRNLLDWTTHNQFERNGLSQNGSNTW